MDLSGVARSRGYEVSGHCTAMPRNLETALPVEGIQRWAITCIHFETFDETSID